MTFRFSFIIFIGLILSFLHTI